MPSKMVSIKTVTITTLDWWLHYEFGNVGLFRHQQQSWTKRKLLLINGRIRCVFGAKLCFHITFLRSRFGDPRWNRAKKRTNLSPTLMDYFWISAAVVERLVTMNCTKSVSDLELSISICWHWLMSDYFCTLVPHPLILERFVTIGKGGMDEISISFVGVAT